MSASTKYTILICFGVLLKSVKGDGSTGMQKPVSDPSFLF